LDNLVNWQIIAKIVYLKALKAKCKNWTATTNEF
jgi:hypothetical protein